MGRNKESYDRQHQIIEMWMSQRIPYARLKKRYGEIPLFYKEENLYSGSLYPYLESYKKIRELKNEELMDSERCVLLAKRISEDIYLMRKTKYRWCDCIKAPNVYYILKEAKKKIYFIQDFNNLEDNIDGYRWSINRLKKKLKRTRKYHQIYYDLLKNKMEEYNSYIKDFKIPLQPRKLALNNKLTTKIVTLKLQGAYGKKEHSYEGWWINRIWED